MAKKIAKTKQSKKELIDLNVSPSKAYLATNCMKWQSIKSGQKLLGTKQNMQDGIDKHAEIEKDIRIVKNFLPEKLQEVFRESEKWTRILEKGSPFIFPFGLEVYQEYPLERENSYKGYRLKVSGKADAIIFDKANQKLYVYDWKTGGSDVSDITEEQLVLYAFCALHKFNDFCEEIELIYVNPELNSSMTKIYSPLEIEQKVFNLIETIGKKLSEGYNIGEHCQYCPARSACPELLKQLKLLISPEVNGKAIETFSEMQLDLIKIGEKVIKELKDRLKAYLTFNPDKSLHGYTISNRLGIREFRIDVDVNDIAELLGIGLDDLFEKKIKSIKKLEDQGLPIDEVKDYIYQPSSKVLKKN